MPEGNPRPFAGCCKPSYVKVSDIYSTLWFPMNSPLEFPPRNQNPESFNVDSLIILSLAGILRGYSLLFPKWRGEWTFYSIYFILIACVCESVPEVMVHLLVGLEL